MTVNRVRLFKFGFWMSTDLIADSLRFDIFDKRDSVTVRLPSGSGYDRSVLVYTIKVFGRLPKLYEFATVSLALSITICCVWDAIMKYTGAQIVPEVRRLMAHSAFSHYSAVFLINHGTSKQPPNILERVYLRPPSTRSFRVKA